MRVLLVDDDVRVLTPLAALLRRSAEVEMADSIDHAVHLLGKKAFDAVVADLNMGERRTGIWLLNEVQRLAPRATRVLLSGSIAVHSREAKAVAHEILVKPVGSTELERVLSERRAPG